MTDALVEVPGVVVTGGADRQDISLRGMGAKYTLILIDGKRQNSRETRTNSDSSGVEGGWTPPLSAIERIEVVRGPMSSLYGSDAMGGVINIITRKVPSEWGGEIRMDSTIQESSKSGDIYQGNFYLAGPIKNDLLGLQIYGRATQRDEDNIYDGFRKRNTNSVTAKLALTPNRDHDIVLEATTARQKIQNTLGKTVAPLAPGERCPRTGCPASSETDYRSNKWALSHRPLGLGRVGQLCAAGRVRQPLAADEDQEPGPADQLDPAAGFAHAHAGRQLPEPAPEGPDRQSAGQWPQQGRALPVGAVRRGRVASDRALRRHRRAAHGQGRELRHPLQPPAVRRGTWPSAGP